MKHLLKGFTLIEIMIVVAIIAILAAVAIPNFVKYRNESQKSACISNMKNLQQAGEQWMMSHGGTTPPNASDLCGSTEYIKKEPRCPYDTGSAYTLALGDAREITVACPNQGQADCAGHVLEGAQGTSGSSGTPEP